jgi:hypothetical protein
LQSSDSLRGVGVCQTSIGEGFLDASPMCAFLMLERSLCLSMDQSCVSTDRCTFISRQVQLLPNEF